MPVVNTSQTFATGDTVTSTTLNNIMDQSVFVAGAVVSGSGLAITAGGQMTTANIPGANITNTSITGGKLASNTITSTNLANSSVINTKIADNAVTTVKIANSNVTTEKIADGDITAPKLSGAQTGTAPIYGIRAWARVASDGSSIENKGFATISRASEGTFNLTLSATPSLDPCVIVTAHPGSNFDWSAHVIINSSTSFTIKTGWYNSWPNDCPFSIMVLY